MALDFTPNTIQQLPEICDFVPQYEKSRMEGHKFVINPVTGDVIAHMGKGFSPAGHRAFCSSVYKVVRDNHTPEQLEGMSVAFRSAHGGGWLRMDITLPNVTYDIVTNNGHKTKTGYRIIALHGVDGTCGNLIYFGAIDFFCTNGMITGEYDMTKCKNTSNFTIGGLEKRLYDGYTDFSDRMARLNTWGKINLAGLDVPSVLSKIIPSEKKAEKMFSLYKEESHTRGENVFSLYSAFTNYATYGDERNNFKIRNTGKDTREVTLFKREQEVAKWVDSPTFKGLVVA
tara:strand:- start:700 stop:1557 length:858 start_codon:yes stop_codon:yes gene_type:complete